MKRYTGQKALYEAISRSQGKAKQGNKLEKLRSEPPQQEKEPAGEKPQPEPELPGAAAEVKQPAAEEPAQEPAKKTLKATKETPPLSAKKNLSEPPVRAELPPLSQKTGSPPVKKTEPSAVKPLPAERIDKGGLPSPLVAGQMRLRPKAVQLNGGCIEVSVPYHVAIAVALALIVVVLAAFRIGQKYATAQVQPAAPVKPAGNPPVSPPVRSTPQPETPAEAPTVDEPARPLVAEPAKPQGDHWIVLAQYPDREDLEPVVQHFANRGIELGIVPLDRARQFFTEAGLNAGVLPSGNGFLLVTKDWYNNPKNPGTNGYEMKRKITEVGREYKAAQGYESFAPHYFSDAYGMKVSKEK